MLGVVVEEVAAEEEDAKGTEVPEKTSDDQPKVKGDLIVCLL